MTKRKPLPKKKAATQQAAPASRRQADAIAGRHAEQLRGLGAHAISIKPDASKRSHVIEVYVPEDFKGTMPARLGAMVRGKKIDVPVKVKKKAKFKAEKL